MRTHLQNVHKIELPKLTPKRKTASARRSTSNSNLEDEDSVDNPITLAEMSGEGSNLSTGDADTDNTTPSKESRPNSSTSTPPTSKRNDHGTLLECWREQTSFAEGGAKHQEVTDALLFMIAHDDMPLRTTERTGFRVFTKKINPKYKIPSEPTTTKKLHEKYLSLRARVKLELGKTCGITLTLDIWTSKHKMDSFLGLTAHYLKGVCMKSVEITARPLQGHKSAENLIPVIKSILNDWNIDPERVSAVITDGGGNIKNAVKEIFGISKHISCFGHLLNLIGTKAIGLNKKKTRPSEMEEADILPDLPEHESDIEDEDVEVIVEAAGRQAAPRGAHAPGACLSNLIKKVKKIVTFFRQSEVATSALNQCQIDAGKKENETLKLIQECKTRWNSAYEMIERFLKLSDFVALTLMKVQREKKTKATPPNMLNNTELGELREVRQLLRPLAQATIEASADQHVTISKIIPLANLMREKIEAFLPESGIAFNLKEQLLNDIITNFGHLEHAKPFAAATLLDPRFKKISFKSDTARDAAPHINEDRLKG
ncbi:hypothetical protein FOCC_FOCC015661 [Frankliniella occidentalis]|nr:hypothetical protein FOCC_FOCC015661 [Frankliniella occidentalis]